VAKGNLREFIVQWNSKYPYDKSWRLKYGVPLFSQKHKDMCLLDILAEYEEGVLFQELYDDNKARKDLEENNVVIPLRDRDYIKGYGNWLKSSEDGMSQEEQDSLFDNIKI